MAVGVDVHCYYQRGIRWGEVTGVNYVWVKVSDGAAPYTKTVGGVVYRPDTHVAGAKSQGIPVGGYHFAQPGDPRAQADLLVREVERLGATGLYPALDIEDPFPIAQARAFGEAFCNRIRERGYRPVVYTGDAYAKVIRPAEWASQPVLWIARYGAKPVFTRFDVHQYSSSGSLPGSAGAVDFNDSYNDSHLNTGGGGGSAVATLDNDDKNFIIDCLGHSAAGRAGGNGVNNLNGWWYNDRFEGNQNFAQVFFAMRDTVTGLKTSLNALTTLVTQNEANDITQEGLAQALQGLVTAEIGPIVRQELQNALGEQNGQQATDVANAVMAKLAEKLSAGAA